jgi:V/A-type H+-transporting ATPase subunit A
MSDPGLVRVSGALADVAPLPGASLYELIKVGQRELLGEVVRVAGETATVQVYEETAGLAVGEPARPTGRSLTLLLGPGLLGGVLDGVGRPLAALADASGDFMRPGLDAPTLDTERRWHFTPTIVKGATVAPGDVIGTVREGAGFEHRILVPPSVSGTVETISEGEFTVLDAVGRLADGATLRLAHEWPVRIPRPVARRLPLERPLLTSQRVFDFLFPVAEGGSVAVPGGFGTGKTVIEQSLAKYADADMPVAAREASVYVGMTIAEYFRDMGYRVAMLADSLSRWAEALREMGARLQEMPGEEGYPNYLGNRLGKFYERAGRVAALGRPERSGSVTLISAVSPPGGDLSEPVTQASLRVVGAISPRSISRPVTACMPTTCRPGSRARSAPTGRTSGDAR